MQLELYFAIGQSFLLHHFPLLHQKWVTTDLGQAATDIIDYPALALTSLTLLVSNVVPGSLFL